jgi:hypothetical protein
LLSADLLSADLLSADLLSADLLSADLMIVPQSGSSPNPQSPVSNFC